MALQSLWRRRPFNAGDHGEADEGGSDSIANRSQVVEGDTHYVGEKAGNDAGLSYQDAAGAPVEATSPLGYAVGPITIFMLNLGKIIGTGIFTTPSSILIGTGSIGLSLIFWCIGFLTSFTAFAVLLEFAAYFPSRSGAEVVYLEQAYPKPRWLFPTAFAVQTVVLSFSSGNCYVLAQYIFKMTEHKPTDWEIKGLAVAGYTAATLFIIIHNRFSYLFANTISFVKLSTLVFISITGFVVLGGNTKVKEPTANFHHTFEGTATAYGITNALYKVIYSYTGFENAFSVVNEIKDPIKQIRRHGYSSLICVSILYILTIIAYYAAATKAEIMSSKLTVTNLFWNNVFGSGRTARGLNFFIVLSAFGNLISTKLGTSRILRECGRQGVLPYTKFWVSTWPFGTTMGPYLFMYAITLVMILAPPAGDAFNFVADLRLYPAAFFDLLTTVGLLIVRHRRKRLNLPRPAFRAWTVVIYFTILKNVYLLVMPWYPPTGGADGGDVSFWYATYIVTSLGILGLCGVYYWLWVYVIPKYKGYKLRQQVVALDDGSQSHELVKVPNDEVEEWDRMHDAVGHVVSVGDELVQEPGLKSSLDVDITEKAATG